MTMAIAFDTLGYSKRLRAGGVDQQHAETHAEAARDYIMSELVTKSDLAAALHAQTVRLGMMMTVGFGILATLMKLI